MPASYRATKTTTTAAVTTTAATMPILPKTTPLWKRAFLPTSAAAAAAGRNNEVRPVSVTWRRTDDRRYRRQTDLFRRLPRLRRRAWKAAVAGRRSPGTCCSVAWCERYSPIRFYSFRHRSVQRYFPRASANCSSSFSVWREYEPEFAENRNRRFSISCAFDTPYAYRFTEQRFDAFWRRYRFVPIDGAETPASERACYSQIWHMLPVACRCSDHTQVKKSPTVYQKTTPCKLWANTV